jgi:hypothetical protein
MDRKRERKREQKPSTQAHHIETPPRPLPRKETTFPLSHQSKVYSTIKPPEIHYHHVLRIDWLDSSVSETDNWYHLHSSLRHADIFLCSPADCLHLSAKKDSGCRWTVVNGLHRNARAPKAVRYPITCQRDSACVVWCYRWLILRHVREFVRWAKHKGKEKGEVKDRGGTTSLMMLHVGHLMCFECLESQKCHRRGKSSGVANGAGVQRGVACAGFCGVSRSALFRDPVGTAWLRVVVGKMVTYRGPDFSQLVQCKISRVRCIIRERSFPHIKPPDGPFFLVPWPGFRETCPCLWQNWGRILVQRDATRTRQPGRGGDALQTDNRHGNIGGRPSLECRAALCWACLPCSCG